MSLWSVLLCNEWRCNFLRLWFFVKGVLVEFVFISFPRTACKFSVSYIKVYWILQCSLLYYLTTFLMLYIKALKHKIIKRKVLRYVLWPTCSVVLVKDPYIFSYKTEISFINNNYIPTNNKLTTLLIAELNRHNPNNWGSQTSRETTGDVILQPLFYYNLTASKDR